MTGGWRVSAFLTPPRHTSTHRLPHGLSIVSILMLDGVTNGAVYALLGLATVLVFTVTRVIFIPQGEFVAYGALTLAIFQTGKVPGTVWLLLMMAVLAA
jgi:branched-chain amino acid transport system permease protein